MTQPLHIAGTLAIAFGIACAAYGSQSMASTIVAPIDAVASTTFDSLAGNNYSILNTIDKSGLSAPYVSGVTNFDVYLNTNPTHTSLADKTEWFSRDYSLEPGFVSQTVTYNFGALTSINGFALWNEEFAGIGNTQLWWAAANGVFTLFDTILPADSAFGSPNYSAQEFEFEVPIDMWFFRLVILDCPGPPSSASSNRLCGIGEVAFSADLGPKGNNSIVPLPAALPLFGTALGLFVWMGRRRKRYT